MSNLRRVCGIAGLFTKSPALREQLGVHLSAMLTQLSDRGPDSAGVAFYRDPAPSGSCKVSLYSPSPDPGWEQLGAELERAFGGASLPARRATHCTFVIEAEAADAQAWLAEHHPELTLMSAGESIEIYKEAGLPTTFIEELRAARDRGQSRARTHPDGHREPGHHRALAPVLHRS